MLLAVADRDRAYGVSLRGRFPDSRSHRVDDIRTDDVEPRLASGDWAGAAVAMADGLRAGGGDGCACGDGRRLLVGGAAVVGRCGRLRR